MGTVAAGDAASDAELSAIASLVSVSEFEPDWRLKTAITAIEHCSQVDPPRGLVVHLSEIHEELPMETLRVLRLTFERDRWGHSLVVDSADLDALFQSLLTSEDERVAAEAASLIDWLVAAGHSRFAELRSPEAG